jgi:DNA-binding CsgD family transcriptional regulator
MDDTTLTSQLIGDIYDAALDRSLWPRVLHRMGRFVRGLSDATDDDPVERDVRLFYQWRNEPHDLDTVLAVQRHESLDDLDDDVRRRMNLLAPHVRRALAIGRMIDRHRIEAGAFADTLDGLAIATFLVGEAARVIYANTHGDELVRERRILRIQDGRLTAVGAAADRALQDAVSAAAAGEAGLGQKNIALALAGTSDDNWVAHVLPLAAGTRRRAGTPSTAAAAVFVRRATLDLPSPVRILAKAYALTPAEMRVLLAFMEAGGVPEVAAMLGISERTVKTHMQRIFGKVGVKRQVDLVKLVASYMTPLTPRKAPDQIQHRDDA